MSRQYSNKKSSSVEQKKFCKVCLDAGKSEKEYTSHYVRASPEPGSKVVCPTLLAAECGYCREIGHTPSCCSTLKAHQKAKRREEQQKEQATKPVPEKKSEKKQVTRGFAALMEDSDDEQEVKKVEKSTSSAAAKVAPTQYINNNNNNFPALPTTKPATKPVTAAAKAVTKPQFMTAIEQSCPGLKLASKMPEVNTYKAPAAKLVRRLTPQQEEDKFINEYIEKHLKNDKQYQKEQKELNKQLASMAKSHESHYGEDDLAYDQQMVCNSSGYDVTELYEEAYQAYIDSKKAKNLDWAALDSDSDSDDEDW
jgi:hypothetical protein